jgi:hypothetical protein
MAQNHHRFQNDFLGGGVGGAASAGGGGIGVDIDGTPS